MRDVRPVKALFESTLQVQTHSHSGRFLIPYELLNKALERGSNLQTMLLGIRCNTDSLFPFTPASHSIIYLLSIYKNTRCDARRVRMVFVLPLPMLANNSPSISAFRAGTYGKVF